VDERDKVGDVREVDDGDDTGPVRGEHRDEEPRG
jgi:hypothetical protein